MFDPDPDPDPEKTMDRISALDPNSQQIYINKDRKMYHVIYMYRF
jgi:hypothetical protein